MPPRKRKAMEMSSSSANGSDMQSSASSSSTSSNVPSEDGEPSAATDSTTVMRRVLRKSRDNAATAKVSKKALSSTDTSNDNTPGKRRRTLNSMSADDNWQTLLFDQGGGGGDIDDVNADTEQLRRESTRVDSEESHEVDQEFGVEDLDCEDQESISSIQANDDGAFSNPEVLQWKELDELYSWLTSRLHSLKWVDAYASSMSVLLDSKSVDMSEVDLHAFLSHTINDNGWQSIASARQQLVAMAEFQRLLIKKDIYQ